MRGAVASGTRTIAIGDPAGGRLARGCVVAGRRIATVAPIGRLTARRGSAPPPVDAALLPPAPSPWPEAGSPVRTWLAGSDREVRVGHDGSLTALVVPHVGRFLIDRGAQPTIYAQPAPDAPTDSFEQTLLGPALLVALAAGDVLALHASAVRVAGAAVAFVGDSGAGKSTLARAYRADAARITDDITPVDVAERGALVRGDYPQLALAGTEPVADDAPLGAIYELARRRGGPIEVVPLTGSAALAVALRHLVAARVFPPALRARALDRMGDAIAGLRVARLGYPSGRDALPHVRNAIASDLAAR